MLDEQEQEALDALPIELTAAALLPPELQHLAPALNRLQGRGIITLVTSQDPQRWALTTPGDFPDPHEPPDAEGAGE